MTNDRIEHDAMGEVRIPHDAYWGAQTQRAIENFPVSGIVFPPIFIRALALIKESCARVNRAERRLEASHGEAIIRACAEVADGLFAEHFPLDIFQTGSGTSTNMNVNEVIATRANELLTGTKQTTEPIHPNDHVNMGQSSNDVIPSAIHVAACLLAQSTLHPALETLEAALRDKARRCAGIVKTGRTHLMDAVPLTLEQELSGWEAQVAQSRDHLVLTMARMQQLAIGGTAVGTGINTPAGFGAHVARELSAITDIEFYEASNHFAAQSGMDAAAAYSGALSAYATSLLKIANDLRLMNSGPFAGFGEIHLPDLQPGSSIMPGKVNPVIPESVRMVCARVIGNNTVIAMANAMGDFQLNVMLPLIAHILCESITIIAHASTLLAEKAIRGFEVDRERIAAALARNPIIATTLNPVIGYEKASKVVKKALTEHKTVHDAAIELGFITEAEARRLLDPAAMTSQGQTGSSTS